jgi:type I restriction enzyme S subunit
MSKIDQKKLVPKVRFEEFKDDWKFDILSNYADVIDPHPSHRAPDAVSDGIPFIGIGDISENGVLDGKSVRLVPKEVYKEHAERYTLKTGDFAYGRVASVGKIVDLSKNIDKYYTYSPTMAIIQPNKIDSNFLRFFCASNYFASQVEAKTSGSTRESIGMQNLRLLKVCVPASPDEQIKIAECLSSLDHLITAESQKLNALIDYKKGLMQQLFPAEGEKVPKLRLEEFRNAEAWKKKEFDEILEITRLAGYEYSEYWEEDSNKEIIALRGYNIGRGKLLLNNLGYISNDLSLKLFRSRLFKGEIVYPCVGTIGNAVVIEEDNKYHIQQNIAKLTPKKDVSPYFISQFLMSDLGMKQVYRFNATSSQPNVLVGSLRKFEVYIPEFEEQQKIASCLHSLDDLIGAQAERIEALKRHKKGLMQGLFP